MNRLAPAPPKSTQALQTTYAQRIGTFNTGLITPIIQTAVVSQAGVPLTRTTKRGTTIINYAEIEEDDDDVFEDRVAGGGRRGTPLNFGGDQSQQQQPRDYGDGIQRVVDIPGVPVSRPGPKHYPRTELQIHHAANRPEVLIPIRIDLDLDSGRRLKDSFLWNLYETLITPDEFAETMAVDLQLPPHMIGKIAEAIRSQLEEYAPVAQVELPAEENFPVIVNLNIHLRNSLFTDKFEWNLAENDHYTPEAFAQITCADMALVGEFKPAISHAIYEATLKSKKEILETPSLISDTVANDAAFDAAAGWRVDQDTFCDDWSPRIETLSREEIEKREENRDRELRRLRRESSRFGTGTVSYGVEEEAMGRGERKKKKRFPNRSPSPTGTPTNSSQLSDWERERWRCQWCLAPGTSVWGVRESYFGEKSICNNCSDVLHEEGALPAWLKGLHDLTAEWKNRIAMQSQQQVQQSSRSQRVR
ncbi:SNF5-domain-containing protein [Ascobolus immersus RN42]|uniref:SNF5-domain-containing protein n=1 Tax=Ascobolus immersus RN42 TaxID=1160509 RepID=A0A3N4HTS2_ASCIM|nr:SNF5-domain-containing protein [Ascobolus immersus RN42]